MELQQITDQIKKDAEENLQPNVVEIELDSENNQVFLTLDSAVHVSRREFIINIGKTATDMFDIALNFFDAEHTETGNIRYRVGVEPITSID